MGLLFEGVRCTTPSTGTGSVEIGLAVPGWRSFQDAAVPNGATIIYGLRNGLGWEMARGVYDSGTGYVSRATIVSTNAGSPINLDGNAEIYIDAAAAHFTSLYNANGSRRLRLLLDDTLSADRSLSFKVGDANRLLDLSAGSLSPTTAGIAMAQAADAQAQAAILTDYFESAGALIAHLAAVDPHPQYLTPTEVGTAAFKNTGPSGNSIPLLDQDTTVSGEYTFTNDAAFSRSISVPAGMLGQTLVIADDAAGIFDTLQGDSNSGVGLMLIFASIGPASGVPTGIYRVRAAGGPGAQIVNASSSSTNVDMSTGVHTGTTGTDGRFTIAAHTNGLIYFENRSGASRTIYIFFMSS